MNTRPSHAPCFARSHDEPEPNVVKGEPLRYVPLRPKPVPTFTGRDANAQGMPQPETIVAGAELPQD